MVAPMKYYRIGLQKIRLEKVGSFQLPIFAENGMPDYFLLWSDCGVSAGICC